MDLLRQIVASPRARHPEAGLDLCYVTESVVATSGPSGTYPQLAYRNPLKDLVKFLDKNHGEDWAIWEFRAEGTGYPDEEVYGRVRHYPWPDHHPPPFHLVPLIMGSMRVWLKGKGVEGNERVAVVHCKAGKGRSGTVSCAYLISEEGWTPEDAMKRFTERRMRPGFGNGISIPSQLRWVGYVDRWTKGSKIYTDKPVEILELHVWGLRNGCKIGIEGYVDEGKVIKTFHTFQKSEREIVRGEIKKENGFADVALEAMGRKKTVDMNDAGQQVKEAEKAERQAEDDESDGVVNGGGDVVFRPSTRVVLPTSDVNIDFERRNKSKYGGFTMVTSVAHVWFNAFFEGKGSEKGGNPDESGVFEIDFDAMDGIKGSSRKGTKCFDKISVVWRVLETERQPSVVVTEPEYGNDIPQARPADWKGGDQKSEDTEKKLGLRTATTESASVSRASSMREDKDSPTDSPKDELDTVRAVGPDGRDLVGTTHDSRQGSSSEQEQSDSGTTDVVKQLKSEGSLAQPGAPITGMTDTARGHISTSTSEVPGGRAEEKLKDAREHAIGSVGLSKKDHSSP
ncbi:hypothetical protein DOTSEDRAFT_69247 [Dothistroma septosporum NZE10]|uniref:phosphatidylinositol-3,4,5-trisphosphate 3-phosphatase n=1 Tax=Dothistroma septosporum (strain NZE10 / CBS 128990) TaxID=675120 RepID=N1PYD6_DOTSN|nr:hypothetical protein DOTSEDRAFT_69247 [Dothistroma septosporum NZE10]